MTYWLYLDDCRTPDNPAWVIVRSYDEFCAHVLENGLPELISFDHDLSDVHYRHLSGEIPYADFKEKTGLDCARWLIEFCRTNGLPMPFCTVHSMNPVGAENIRNALAAA